MTMLGGRGKRNPENCEHSETMAVISAGIERIVCESCGYVSFMFLDTKTDDIDRDAFARSVDELETVEMVEAV